MGEKEDDKMVEEKYINKEYLDEVDKEVKMIPLTFDVVLKGMFERNQDLLKRFVISVLKLEIDSSDTDLEITKNELLKENIKEYQKRVDILVILNDNIHIDIEINRSNFEKSKFRNSLYWDKLYTTLLETGEKASELKNFYLYQLNLNTEDKSISFGEDRIILYSTATKEIFIDNKIMVLKYLEFYRKLYYTNVDNLKEDEIWLAALTAKRFTELNEMLSHILNDMDRSRFVKEAIRMSKLNFSLRDWEAEKMNDLMREESRRVDREEARAEGLAEGFAEGIEQGVEQGIEQTNLINIKNMYAKNISLEDIADITGKSIDEIEKIIKK